ncbi:MAG: amidohydrolase family protein, partial [Bryobacteraceae bacterium]
EDGAVLVVNGVISSVGPSRRVENLAEARNALEMNASGRVVMPGLIDSHTYLISGPPLLDDIRSPGLTETQQILAAVRLVRSAPARTLEFQARRILQACARHGTTSLESKSGYGLDDSSELKILRVLAEIDKNPINVVATYFGAHIMPPEFNHNRGGYLEWVRETFLPKVAARKLARFACALCSPAGFSIDEARGYLQAARRLGLIPKVHAEQTSQSGGTRLAVETEAASADGLNYATSEDADLLARSNVIATVLPADYRQGVADRPAPARLLIDHGAALAIATGFHHGKMPGYNMQHAASIACKDLKLTAAEAISASTINGAHAIRSDGRCGSLQFGKDADLIILNVADYREISYYSGVNLVSATMRRGEVIYQESEVTWEAKK